MIKKPKAKNQKLLANILASTIATIVWSGYSVALPSEGFSIPNFVKVSNEQEFKDAIYDDEDKATTLSLRARF